MPSTNILNDFAGGRAAAAGPGEAIMVATGNMAIAAVGLPPTEVPAISDSGSAKPTPADVAFSTEFGDGDLQRGLRRLVSLGRAAAVGPVDAALFSTIRMGA